MKKVLVLFWVIVLFSSCDQTRYYDYFIDNNCNETIEIEIEICKYNCNIPNKSQTEKFSVQISPNTTQLIHSADYFQPLYDGMVEYFFKEIMITKGNDTSKINYINRNLWRFEPTSKDHANSYLTVTMEDFEDKPSGGR